MGFFDVPTVERKPWGILGLILNIIPFGVGTIVAGVKEGQNKGRYILVGILQLVVIGLGWVWSIVWGIRIFRASTSASAAPAGSAAASTPAKSTAASDYQPQCAALTEDGQQCRNSARGTSKYCSSHKGYQPPTAKGLAKRIEGEDWSDEDKTTDRQSVKGADTKPAVSKAPDTRIKVRKAPKKAAKKATKKSSK